MANFVAFRWNFSSSTNPEIGKGAIAGITVAKKVSGANVVVVSSETAEFCNGFKNGCIRLFLDTLLDE